ncbi:MAG TPA: MarR family transcriptional regulator [Acetobacteraceae bacterium]|jgi:DNA-binding MarR family transcriptional regulator
MALRLPPTRLGRLTDSVGFHLRMAHEAAQRNIAAGIAATGLEPAHAEVLAVIAENPGIIPSAVAEAIGRDRSSITGTLHVLTGKGLIQRERTRRDRRASLLRLTEDGEAMHRRLLELAAAHDALLDRIAGEGKPALLAQLRRITTALADGDRNDDPGNDV